jgi:hypothetical protein
VQNRSRDDIRRVDGRRQYRLLVEMIFGVLNEERVDASGLDERHRYGRAFIGEFDAQRIGIAFYRVLRGHIRALQRDGDVRQFTAQTDERPAFLTQMLHGD